MTSGIKLKIKKFYHNFEVIREIPIVDRKSNRRRIEVKCICGNIKIIALENMISKNTISCGCVGKANRLKGVFKHGQAQKTLIYSKWKGLRSRVNNKNRQEYKHYGGRGITVCKRWDRFENFFEDMNATFEQHLVKFGQKNTTLERIDNDKGYCKKNCKWATRKEQANNTRRIKSSISEQSEETKLKILKLIK